MDNHTPTPDTPPVGPQPAPGKKENGQPSIGVILGWLVLALLIIGVAGAAWFQQLRKQRVGPPPPVYEQVSAPTFTDQDGKPFEIASLDGRIWVVDFIFTRCGAQCPVMTTRKAQLQTWLTEKEMGNVQLVTITVDPEFDTPEVLKRYAERFKAEAGRWHFLTGDRATIYNFILEDFHLETAENEGLDVADMFVHSDKFVLVDRNRNIRGYYSAMEVREMDELREAITSISHHEMPVSQ